ncbi:MAG: hypothetical protein QF460_01710 [Candidatus Nanoarchaeia archaeon]|jgi:hypothetical protein|nr:hypothetical protein [Candidatus Nanoarchaeia archaeon]|tara:strand:- start:1765 stop:1947 length:183 start_codon:yes stop_codon:yes gene_type:complete
MVTVNQMLNFASVNRDAFSEVVKLASADNDDILIQILEEKTQEIGMLRKQLKILKEKLNS